MLIAGLRRLKAMELLGAEEIRATVMTALEADEMLMLEIAENEQRKEFTVSEKLAFAEKLKAVEAEKARVRKSAGGKGGLDQDVANWPHLQEQGRSRDIVAQKAGFTSTTQMRRAQAVSESRPDLMEQVDKGEKSISGAYSDMQREIPKHEEPQAAVKAKADDDVLTGLIQEKPVEVPEFDVYRPALEPAPATCARSRARITSICWRTPSTAGCTTATTRRCSRPTSCAARCARAVWAMSAASVGTRRTSRPCVGR